MSSPASGQHHHSAPLAPSPPKKNTFWNTAFPIFFPPLFCFLLWLELYRRSYVSLCKMRKTKGDAASATQIWMAETLTWKNWRNVWDFVAWLVIFVLACVVAGFSLTPDADGHYRANLILMVDSGIMACGIYYHRLHFTILEAKAEEYNSKHDDQIPLPKRNELALWVATYAAFQFDAIAFILTMIDWAAKNFKKDNMIILSITLGIFSMAVPIICLFIEFGHHCCFWCCGRSCKRRKEKKSNSGEEVALEEQN